jgi:hypothetical protein
MSFYHRQKLGDFLLQGLALPFRLENRGESWGIMTRTVLLGLVLAALAAVWLERPGSLWGYAFHASLAWHQGEETFPLANRTPFAWDRVCMADRSYYDDQAYGELNQQIGVRGFDSRTLAINGDERGGFLLFVRGDKVIPVEWNDFGGFGAGALKYNSCWNRTFVIKRVKDTAGIMYLPQ